MNVYLIDSSLDPFGHNVLYMDALLTVPNTVKIDKFIPSISGRLNLLSIIRHKYTSFKKLLSLVPNNSMAHFLYGDLFYLAPYFRKLEKKQKKIIVTMHYFPENRVKQFFLKNFCRKISSVIVHSEFIKQQYENIGIKNVHFVNYPSFYDYAKVEGQLAIKNSLGIPPDKIVISALGGTRYDKGLDILLESFHFIPDEVKERILVNIVGRKEHFDEPFTQEFLIKYNISCRLFLQGVSDNDFMKNVKLTDIMVLPYRKSFTGNSGPMTEAIVNSIPLIVPDRCNLANIARKYNLGLTFEPENPMDLAEKIVHVITQKCHFNFDFKENLHLEEFVLSHKKIYNSLINS